MRRCAFAIRAFSSLRAVALCRHTLQAASFGTLYLLSHRSTSSPDTAVADGMYCDINSARRLGVCLSLMVLKVVVIIRLMHRGNRSSVWPCRHEKSCVVVVCKTSYET